jgi:hypothetical protein
MRSLLRHGDVPNSPQPIMSPLKSSTLWTLQCRLIISAYFTSISSAYHISKFRDAMWDGYRSGPKRRSYNAALLFTVYHTLPIQYSYLYNLLIAKSPLFIGCLNQLWLLRHSFSPFLKAFVGRYLDRYFHPKRTSLTTYRDDLADFHVCVYKRAT